MAQHWLLTKLIRLLQGVYVYVLALLGIRLASLESQRFQLVKTPNEEERASALLVSFAGSTLLVGGFPRGEFRGMLTKAASENGVSCDQLFLVDPSVTFFCQSPSNSSKWTGLEELAEQLNTVADKYDKVIAVGSSMGATALLALCGRFHCDAAVTFNPLVDLNHHQNRQFWVGGQRLPSSVRRQLPYQMGESCSSKQLDTHRRVIVHYSKSSLSDVDQVERLQAAVKRQVESTGGRSVLEVYEHECDKHVLPRQLKAEGKLLPLLAEVLRETLSE